MNQLLRITSCLIVLLALGINGSAKKIPAFIVTQNGDTIFGKVRSAEVSLLSFNGLGYEGYFEAVPFKALGEKRFITVLPDSIKTLHVSASQGLVIYKTFELEYRNMTTLETLKKQRLLQLLYSNSHISLYQNQYLVNSSHFQKSSESLTGRKLSDYYLYQKELGLTKVESSESIKSLKELLRMYNFEEDFITSLDSDINFKDIQTVLKLYQLWLNSPKE